MAALGTVLSLFKIWEAPLGGSVTLFSMVPILLIGHRHGLKWGFGTAFIYSALQLLLGIGTVSYVPDIGGILMCILLDYILAFTVLGITGVFKVSPDMTLKRIVLYVILGTLVACVLRFVFHLLSGAVVWYAITKEQQWNDYVSTVGMWTYSTVYNLQYMVPETIIALIAAPAEVAVLKNVKNK